MAAWTNILIGGTLLLSALIRFFPPVQNLFMALLERHFAIYHLVMGLTHGLTNLGGALLAVLAIGTSDDKRVIRNIVAHYYLAFSTIQMLVLAVFFDRLETLAGNMPAVFVSTVVYLTIGNRIFFRIENSFYNKALTAFIAAYGVIILLDFQP